MAPGRPGSGNNPTDREDGECAGDGEGVSGMAEFYAGNGKRKESWLDLYLGYTRGLEAPTLFHKWAAIAGCGHVLGRRVWCVRWAEGYEYPVYPGQVMVCLVAATALLRKSTAVDAMARLLRDLTPGTVNLLPARTSPSMMIKSLQPRDEVGDPIDGADCVGLILASELGAFFSAEGFLETMATHVTNLNDAPHGRYDPEVGAFRDREYELRFMNKDSSATLLNPCVGMLAATTPVGMAKELPTQAQTAGLFGRMLMVWQETTDRTPNALVDRPPQDEQLRRAGRVEAMLEGLQRMGQLQGEFRLTKQAKEYFRDWYEDHCRQHQGAATSAESGYIGRKGDHAIRVATVLAAMELVRGDWPPPKQVIREGHLRTALSWLRALEPGFERAIGETAAARRLTVADTVLRYLRRPRNTGKWVARREIQRRLWHRCQSGKELRLALDTLVEIEKVRMRERERGRVEYKARRGVGLSAAGEVTATE